MKPYFVGDCELVQLPDGKNWRVAESFSFHSSDGGTITVPKGFITDLASIPALERIGATIMAVSWLIRETYTAWFVLLAIVGFILCWLAKLYRPYGKHSRADVLHDWMYRECADLSKWECDAKYRVAMSVDKVRLGQAEVMYAGVAMFGWASFLKDRKELAQRKVQI